MLQDIFERLEVWRCFFTYWYGYRSNRLIPFYQVGVLRFFGINFAMAGTETLNFLHPANCEHFASYFLKFVCL